MKTYEVANRPMTHNGKTYKVGDTVQFPAADGAILVEAGRLKDKIASAPQKA